MEIDKLYNLIINSSSEEKTFQDNFELWKDFYDDRSLRIRKNINDKRLYTIIQFLLKNEQGQIFDYFQSNILDTLYFEEQRLNFNLRNNCPDSQEAFFQLWNSLENHETISKYLNEIPIPEDGLTKNSVNQYQSYNLKLDIIEAIIIILHQDFFHIAPELVHKTVDYIEKEITTILNQETKSNLLHVNLIYQYIDKFIPIERYLGKELTQNQIIEDLLNGRIQDKKIITKLFKSLTDQDLLELFNYDVTRLIQVLDNFQDLDDVYKQSLIYQIGDRLLTEEDFEFFFPLLIEQSSNTYLKNYLTEENKQKIITFAMNSNPLLLEVDTIIYLLDNRHVNAKLLRNLNEFLQETTDNLTDEEKNLLKTKLEAYPVTKPKEYSLLEANQIMNNYLEGKVEINEGECKDLIVSIIKNIAKARNTQPLAVYFVETTTFNGRYSSKNDDYAIEISQRLIDQLLNKKKSLYNRIRIFITLLHELQHSKQFDKNNPLNIEKYKRTKESLLERYDPAYYTSNYQIVDIEIDARVESYQMLSKFLEAYYPNLLDQVQASIIVDLQKELAIKQKRDTENQVKIINKSNIDFNLSFDSLLEYNTNILEAYPVFNIEYHKNGTPKSYEDILITKTAETEEIIAEIIKRRYPELIQQEIKPKHI